MRQNVDLLIKQNPEFEYHLFDDKDCRDFISQYFSSDVLNAFDNLLPGAYKADLWRYCVLYINGGIYLDIKYKCVNGFKLIALTEKEHFCNDWSHKTMNNKISCDEGIYNAIMVCKPGNDILLFAIKKIVDNVKNKNMGKNPLEPTGPYLLKDFFTQEERKNFDLDFYKRLKNHHVIRYKFCLALESYPEYRSEQKEYSPIAHYNDAWNSGKIYK